MGKLSEYLNEHRSRRDPPYRPLAVIDDAEREWLDEKIGDRAMEQAYDYNWADEVLHVAIGDYFLKKIAEQRPETEATALKVQAQTELNRAEGQRSGGEDVINEVKAFLEEEADVAASALAGPLSDGAKPGEDGY